MTTTLLVAAYLFVAVLAWRKVYAWLYRTHHREFRNLEWDNGDRTFGVIWGGAVALGWPIAAAIAVAVWAIRSGPWTRALRRLEVVEDERREATR